MKLFLIFLIFIIIILCIYYSPAEHFDNISLGSNSRVGAGLGADTNQCIQTGSGNIYGIETKTKFLYNKQSFESPLKWRLIDKKNYTGLFKDFFKNYVAVIDVKTNIKKSMFEEYWILPNPSEPQFLRYAKLPNFNSYYSIGMNNRLFYRKDGLASDNNDIIGNFEFQDLIYDPNKNNYIAVGLNGLLHSQADFKGPNWVQMSPGDIPIKSIAIIGNTYYGLSSDGTRIYKKTNPNIKWTTDNSIINDIPLDYIVVT